MNTVTINPGHKLGECAEQQGCFSAMNNVLAIPGALCATNGRIMAVVPCEGTPLSTLLPAKACNANGKAVTLELNGEVRAITGQGPKAKTTVYPFPEQEGRFPALGQVFPNIETHVAVALDADELRKLCEAITSNADGKRVVTLFVPLPEKGKAVTSPLALVAGTEGPPLQGIGLISPLSLGGDLARRVKHYQEVCAKMPMSGITFAK